MKIRLIIFSLVLLSFASCTPPLEDSPTQPLWVSKNPVLEQQKKVAFAKKRRLYINEIRKADYLALRNQSTEALNTYLWLLEKLGKDNTLERKIANVYFTDKNWSEASRYYQHLVYTDLPKDEQVRMIQSILFDETEKDARSSLERIVADPGNLEYYKAIDTCHTGIHNCIITIMASTGTGKEMMPLREITMSYSKITPDFYYRNMLVAAKLFEQGMFRASKVLSEEILLKRPDYKEAMKLLGFSYKGLGKYEKARDMLTNYLELFPKDTDTIVALGEIYFTLGDYTLSNLYLNNAILADSEDKIGLERRLAYNYIMMDDFDGALKVFAYILQREEALEDDFVIGASLAGMMNEWVRAYAWTSEGLRRFPGSSLIHTERSRELRNLGKYSEAMAQVDEALRLAPENTKAQAERAILLYYTAELDTARQALESIRARISDTSIQTELDEYIVLTKL